MSNQTKIIDAATSCFIEKGFHATSMRDIAKYADVSLGNIYNHFASKTDLILAIAHHELRDIEVVKTRFTKPSQNALTQILALGEFLLKDLCQPGVGILTLEIAAEAARNIEIEKAFETNRQQMAYFIQSILKVGQQVGQISTDIDTNQASYFILEFVDGLALREPNRRKLPTKKARQELTLIITKYLQV